MFWPPSFTANVRVSISDALNANPRFAPYTQDATVLSPWLSWATIDTRWPASDPMMRVLLAGQPPAQLRSVNADGLGAVIQLGDPPRGQQGWEVVSFFDWYTTTALKIGAFAWCRLTPPAVLLPPFPTPCGACPAAALSFEFVLSGMQNAICSDCANLNGTVHLDRVPAVGGVCKWQSAAFPLCGSPGGYNWILEQDFAGHWRLQCFPVNVGGIVAEYRIPAASFSCLGPNLMTYFSGNPPGAFCVTWPPALLLVRSG